jgi:hypothetical protein
MASWRRVRWFLACVVVEASAAGGFAPSVMAGVILTGSGPAASGRVVAARATVSIVGDDLTVDLENVSPANTAEASEVLTSLYFDIRKGGVRPPLSFASATGFVWLVRNGTNDMEYRYVPQTFTQVSGIPSDLKAVNRGDASWQFLTMDETQEPFFGLGLGTVGNSDLDPNGFDPSVVGPPGNTMLNFGIYRGGDINPKGVLANRYVVKNKATFRFKGAAGYDESDIVEHAAFGFGTGPDSVVIVPEPPAAILAPALTALGVALRRLRRRPSPSREAGHGPRPPSPCSAPCGTDRRPA